MQPIKQWFAGLSPDGKRKTFVFGALTLLIISILIGVIATEDGSKPKVETGRKKKIETSLLTGKDPGKVGIEQLQATTKRQELQIEQLERKLQSVANQNGAGGRGGSVSNGIPFPFAKGDGEVVALPGSAGADVVSKGGAGSVSVPAVSPVKATEKAVEQAVNDDPAAPRDRNGKPLPKGAAPASGRRATAADSGAPSAATSKPRDNADVYGVPLPDVDAAASVAPPPPPKLKLRVLSPRTDAAAERQETVANASNTMFTQPQTASGRSVLGSGGKAARDPEFYLPLGAIISGTLLTGLDAPASGAAARKDPFPALLRVKHEAILPNAGLLDLRECFLVASAYAELASQRVYLRAEGLSCQRSDGAIIESSIDAYASGSDGKAGVRGRVVDKTAELIKDSLLAGFVGGLAKGFKPSQSTAVSVNPVNGSTAAFQFPDPAFVMGNGILSGASGAADRIAGIYEDLAKQVVPVVEINAGIPVDFIMTRGATLRFKKVGEVSGTRAAASPQQQHPRGDQATTSVSGTNGFSVTQGAGSATPPVAPGGANQTFSSRKN